MRFFIETLSMVIVSLDIKAAAGHNVRINKSEWPYAMLVNDKECLDAWIEPEHLSTLVCI